MAGRAVITRIVGVVAMWVMGVVVLGIFSTAYAGCIGHTKCGVPIPPSYDCDPAANAYWTTECLESGSACYGWDEECGSGAFCQKGDTCQWVDDGGSPAPSSAPSSACGNAAYPGCSGACDAGLVCKPKVAGNYCVCRVPTGGCDCWEWVCQRVDNNCPGGGEGIVGWQTMGRRRGSAKTVSTIPSRTCRHCSPPRTGRRTW